MSNNGNVNNSMLDNFKSSFQKNSMYYILIVLIVAFQLLTDGVFLDPVNITNIILQNSYILILAIGMLLVIILGDVDLSVGAVAAFIGALSAILIIRMGLPTSVSIVLCLLVGVLIGAFQGFWISYVNVPAFIATLAGQLIFSGLTIVILDGRTLAPFPSNYQIFSSGFIPDVFNGSAVHIFTVVIGVLLAVAFVISSLRKRKKQKEQGVEVESNVRFTLITIATILVAVIFSYVMALYEGLPNVLILLAILVMGYSFVTNRTTVGRRLYATGGNEKAASLSGIKTKRLKLFAFMNMGLLSAVAGIVFSGRLNAATATAGQGFELDAIAACYIGGASAYGGEGTVTGAIIGGLVMGVLNNGMSLMGIGVDWQQAIKGAVLLLAVAFDIYSKKKVN